MKAFEAPPFCQEYLLPHCLCGGIQCPVSHLIKISKNFTNKLTISFLFVTVTRGIIKGVQTSDEETSQLNIRVTKLIRHIPTDTEEDDLLDRNEIVTHTQGRTARSVNIHVASQCGVSHGTGEFVFMARRRLGDFTIKCAPRLEDWIQTVRLVREQGRDHCLLNS